MKVCLVSNLYPPDVIGGAEVVVGHLARGLAARGHETTVITTTARRPTVADVDGVHVHRLAPGNLYAPVDAPRRPRAIKPLWHLLDLWNPAGFLRVRRLLTAGGFDLVHTHNVAGLSPAVWSAARAAGRPVVHTPHDYALTCVRAMRMTRRGRVCETPCVDCGLRARWLRRLSAGVDTVVAPSQFVLDRHVERGFFPTARREVIRWGLPDAPRPSGGDRPGPVRFLFMGQLRAHKGVRVLLDAFARIRHVDARLDIAGTGDLAQASRTTGDPRIRYHGFVAGADKAALLSAAHVLVLPATWWEVAPLAITEAMAHGLPVVASRVGGIPEMVDEGVTGFLVEPGDPAGLAERLAALAGDPALVGRLAAACVSRAPELGLGRTLDRLLQVYAEVGRR